MRRTDWKAPVIIIMAFLIGIVVNILVRQFLPVSMAGGKELIAVVAQILVSTTIIFITVKIMQRGEDD